MIKEKNILFLIIFLQILFAITYYLLNIDDLILSELFLLLIFIEVFILSFLKKGINYFQIFLVFSLFFNYSIPFAHLFNLYEYPLDNALMYEAKVYTPISDQLLIKTYKLSFFFLIGCSLGWLLSLIFQYNLVNNKFKISKYNLMTDKFVKFIFCTFFLAILLIYSYRFYYFVDLGYVEVFHRFYEIPNLKFLFLFCEIAYPAILCLMLFSSINHGNLYIKYLVIGSIPLILTFFMGLRAELIMTVITLLFFYNKIYKINYFSLFILFIVITFFSFYVDSIRMQFGNTNAIIFFDLNYFKDLLDKFINYSSSIAVLSYSIIAFENELFDNKYPFIFGYFFGIFSLVDNYSFLALEQKSYLAMHLISILDPDKFLRGSSVGSSIIAELYLLVSGNIPFLILTAAAMILIVSYFDKRVFKNIYFFYFSFLLFHNFFFSARGSIGRVLSKEIVFGIIIIFLIKIFFYIKKTGKIKTIT